MVKEQEKSGNDSECPKNQELDESLRESASISAEPIRSGIGLSDFFQMIREGMASSKDKPED